MSESRNVVACDEVRERLEAYVDGELAHGEAGGFEHHVGSCAGCARELRLAAAIRRGLRELPALDAPARVLQAIFDQTRTGQTASATVARFRPRNGEALSPPAEPAGGAPARARWPAWAALAAALLAVAAGLTLWSPAGAPPEPDPAEIARAEREARFALALVGRLGREAGAGVRDRLVRRLLVEPAEAGLARSLAPVREPDGRPSGSDDPLPPTERG